jgi:hypothetical protein
MGGPWTLSAVVVKRRGVSLAEQRNLKNQGAKKATEKRKEKSGKSPHVHLANQ